MDPRRFIAHLLLVLCLTSMSCFPTLAREVACPAFWPGDSSKSPVVKGDVFNNDQVDTSSDVRHHGSRYEALVDGNYIDLQCSYKNSRILFFPLHGDYKICHYLFISTGSAPNIHIRTYCKLNAHDSADPNQGPFVLAEPLTRHSDVLGFRLDMSRAEIEAAIDQLGAMPIDRQDDLIKSDLADGRKLGVQFSANGKIQKIVIDSNELADHDFFHSLQHHFGSTSDRMEFEAPGWTPFWEGSDGTRLEIKAWPGAYDAPHVVGSIDTSAPQQVRLIDTTVK
jgi:hypothetical protein